MAGTEDPTKQEPAGKEPEDGAKDPGTGTGAPDGGASEPAGKEPEDGDLKDKHGNPAVARGVFEREMKERDDRIAELQAQVDAAAKSAEEAQKLRDEIEKVKQDGKDSETRYRLELAGCRNVKAAKAILDDYDGDIEKCKAENPYLFGNERQAGSTGAKPDGAAGSGEDEAEARAFRVR